LITFLKTDNQHPDFRQLIALLDAELRVRDGEDHAFYSQYNKPDNIPHVLVAYDGNVPVGCGAMKIFAQDTLEIKRMFVLPASRGGGIATAVLTTLEAWAMELNIPRLILETGKNQPEALALYAKQGYEIIPNYGQYADVENSVCFEKILSHLD
jgi:putative acetyltransferase